MNNLRLFALSLVCAAGLAACSGTEGRKTRFLERGETYLAQNDLDKARVELSNALQIDPNNAQARYLVALIAEKQGRIRDAVSNYQAALEADPELLTARSALGRIYLLGGLRDRAREVIEPGLLQAPDNAQLLTIRGGLRAVEGDTAGAMQDAEAAVNAAPADELAVAFLAAQYTRQGRSDEAIATLEKGLEQIPGSTDLPVLLADLLQQAGRRDDAVKRLTDLVNAHSEILANWQRLSHLYLLNQNPQAAEQALQQAVAANPDSVEAKTMLVTLIGENRKDVTAAIDEMQKFVDADPANADLRVAQGQLLESAGLTARAEAIYQTLIASEGTAPKGLMARNRLATMLVRREQYAQAQTLIEQVLSANARDNDALILRAGIELTQGQTTDAITDLRAVLRDQPGATSIMRTLARAHVQEGNLALAEEVLRGAVQANPSDVQNRFELASLLGSAGRASEALPVLQQLVLDAPDDLQAWNGLVRVLAATGDLVGARKAASDLKNRYPNLPHGALLLGALAEQQRDLPQATNEYEYALSVSDDPSDALAALTRVDVAQKQPARAIARIETVIGKEPKLARAHNLLGEVQMAQGQIPVAVRAFDAAIAAQPDGWQPYRNKANALMAMKQPDEAVAALRKGIDQTAGALELYASLASVQEKQGQIDEAISTYESALERHPRALAVANNLAMLLVTHRQNKTGLARATQVAQLLVGSEVPAMLDTLGWVRYHNGDFSEALTPLRKAGEKSPQSPAIHYHLGMAQLRSGDRAGAKLSLETALASNTPFEGAEEARRALDELGR
ncbi:MAG: tetratricopeptide repeat protein [Nevskiaceae bacterium]|jgi:tetratricopeptide (TPR) repeat protein|nr:tetratricopeptide repeat protein [Nevskiaceae bacterium]